MDFGLARRTGTDDAELTQTGALLGHARTTCRPSRSGATSTAIGPATDIYALGVILYELLDRPSPVRGADSLVLGADRRPGAPPPSTHRPGLDPGWRRSA